LISEHPALPPPVSRPWLACAGAACATAFVVSSWAPALFLVAIPVLWLSLRGHAVVAMIVTATGLAVWGASAPVDPVPPGPISGQGMMATDVLSGRYGPYALIALEDGAILADLPPDAVAARGDLVRLDGLATGEPGTVGGRQHRGTVRVRQFEVIGGPTSPIMSLGNAIRERVSTRLTPLVGGRALLAGFLVGNTDGIAAIDEEAMRRSGLSHFTAVSGSNVALFLAVVFIALGPIGVGPRRRAVIGLLVLPVFAAATRFEPSVLRASVMAGIGLAGRLVGVSLEAWQILSAAVIGLVLLEPELVTNPGFQLSVAAAAGVMVGARWPVDRRLRTLTVAIGAQVGVAPLLIAHFGLMPLLSPLVNLAAAPMVALSTVLGVVGMVGPGQFATAGAWLAGLVLWLARFASGWPQIGWLGLLTSASLVLLFFVLPRLRGGVAVTAGLLAAVLILGQSEQPPSPGVVVLDVGQGDAILVSGGGGHYALVDGGPDPVRLISALRRYRVNRLELVILTHVHADHAAGLTGLIGRVSVGEVWADPEPHRAAAADEFFRLLAIDVPVERPSVGQQWALGELTLTVEGPLRRYASPNDQSIVVMVESAARSMLLSGDIEEIAQRELVGLRADVLKVPHHGARTSDLDWLVGVGSDLAVIPVGPNDFGHPSDMVIETLEDSGGVVHRTDVTGDVVVPMG